MEVDEPRFEEIEIPGSGFGIRDSISIRSRLARRTGSVSRYRLSPPYDGNFAEIGDA